MPSAANTETIDPQQVCNGLAAAKISLTALGVHIITGPLPAETRHNGADWDGDTLRVGDHLDPQAQLAVLVDMWHAIVLGPDTPSSRTNAGNPRLTLVQDS